MALLVDGGKCKIQGKKVHCRKSNIFINPVIIQSMRPERDLRPKKHRQTDTQTHRDSP